MFDTLLDSVKKFWILDPSPYPKGIYFQSRVKITPETDWGTSKTWSKSKHLEKSTEILGNFQKLKCHNSKWCFKSWILKEKKLCWLKKLIFLKSGDFKIFKNVFDHPKCSKNCALKDVWNIRISLIANLQFSKNLIFWGMTLLISMWEILNLWLKRSKKY